MCLCVLMGERGRDEWEVKEREDVTWGWTSVRTWPVCEVVSRRSGFVLRKRRWEV